MGFWARLMGKDVDAIRAKAGDQMSAEQWSSAAATLGKLVDLNPEASEPWFLLGTCYSQQVGSGDGASKEDIDSLALKAHEAFVRALDVSETDDGLNPEQTTTASLALAQFIRTKAGDQMNAQQWNSAAETLGELIEMNPAASEPWYLLGICHTQQAGSMEGATEEAIQPVALKAHEAFVRALEISETDEGLHPDETTKACFAAGMFLQTSKEYEESIPYLERATSAEPDRIEYAMYLSTSLARLGNFDDAEKLVVGVLDEDPADPGPLSQWKFVRELAGRPATVDLDEERRKTIYADYISAKNDSLLGETDLLANFGAIATGNPMGALARMSQELERSGAEADAAARRKVAAEYGLKRYQLTLIAEEGEAEGWG